jgi:hypothetical protein
MVERQDMMLQQLTRARNTPWKAYGLRNTPYINNRGHNCLCRKEEAQEPLTVSDSKTSGTKGLYANNVRDYG